MNFFQKFFGVFLSPNLTFKAISEKPVWVEALITLLLVVIVFSYLVGPYKAKDSAAFLRSNIKLQEKMGEEKFILF
ncbi:MAG: hypothetical protein ACE5WD_13675 [Candidatus Aminicenantia bacterium]